MRTLGVTAAALSGGGRVGAEVDRHGGESRVSLPRVQGARRGVMRVADVMAPPPPRVPMNVPIGSARKIAALRAADLLLVEVEEQLVGLLDLSLVGPEHDANPVASRMTSLAFAVSPNATVRNARACLRERGASSAPVVAGLFVVGAFYLARIEQTLFERSGAAARAAA